MEEIGISSRRAPNKILLHMYMIKKRYTPLILSIFGAIFGIVMTIILSSLTDLNEMPRRFEFLYLLGFPGMLFLRLLQLIVIPLVMISISYAVGSMDVGTSGVLGLKAAAYFLFTTVIATIIGISLSMIVLTPERVGKLEVMRGATMALLKEGNVEIYVDLDKQPNPNYYTLLDILRNLFPTSIVGAFVTQERIKTPVEFDKPIPSQIERTSNPNILGLICIAVFGGMLLAKVSHSYYGKLLLNVLHGLNMVMAVITSWLIRLTPIGVMSLVMDNVLRSVTSLQHLGMGIVYFILTVVAALAVQLFLVQHLLFFIMTRQNPFKFFGGVLEAYVTALATASSSATLPLLMHCLETKNGVDPRISSFVTSIGATVNMNGTALYEALAAIFLATMALPRALAIGDYVVISIAATMAAVGAAGIPSAGLVTMIMVLDSIGVNPALVAFILPLDVLLDRLRTSINVMGNAFGAGIINHLMRNKLEELDRHRMQEEALRSPAPLEDEGNNEGAEAPGRPDAENKV